MSYWIIIFLAMATWALLAVIGNERTRRVQNLEVELRDPPKPEAMELQAVDAPPTPASKAVQAKSAPTKSTSAPIPTGRKAA